MTADGCARDEGSVFSMTRKGRPHSTTSRPAQPVCVRGLKDKIPRVDDPHRPDEFVHSCRVQGSNFATIRMPEEI